jgi:hypothetical protein
MRSTRTILRSSACLMRASACSFNVMTDPLQEVRHRWTVCEGSQIHVRSPCQSKHSRTRYSASAIAATSSPTVPRLGLDSHCRRESRPSLSRRGARPALCRCDRYEAATGNPAVLIETGEAFDLLAGRRSREAAPVWGRIERGALSAVLILSSGHSRTAVADVHLGTRTYSRAGHGPQGRPGSSTTKRGWRLNDFPFGLWPETIGIPVAALA